MKNYTLKEYADLLSSVDMLAEAEMMGRDEDGHYISDV